MNNKVVFLDIDGTILNENKEIPESTKEAVSKLQENGVYVAIATGRAPFMFKDILKELNITTYVSFNGSYVVFDGEVLFTHPLDKDQLLELEKTAFTYRHPMVFLNENLAVSNWDNHPFIEESMSSLKMSHPEKDEHFHHNNEVYQALLFTQVEEGEKYPTTHNHFDYVRWHPKALDVLPKGGSKARGIQELLHKLNIPVENTYAFGDALNDLEMLEYVGCGIAMGNGVPEAKEAADFITTHVDENGIYNGLKKVGLI